MRYILATILASVSLCTWPPLAGTQPTGVQFRKNYSEARTEADKKGMPIIVFCISDNCPDCERLQRDTFSDPAVANSMNDKFVPIKVHATQQPEFFRMTTVQTFPTIFLAAPDGRILKTVQGYQDAAVFKDNLQSVLAAISKSGHQQR